MRTRGSWTAVAWAAALVLATLSATASAQGPPLLPTPTPTPRPTTGPQPTPTPDFGPEETPIPSNDPRLFPPTPSPTPGPTSRPTPAPGATPAPSATPDPDGGQSPEEIFGIPPGFEIPRFARTPGRSTLALVGILEQVTEVGIGLTDALVAGMGRFPVAGLAFYSDDWMYPRFTPSFHLHEGIDIFADEGTPVRAPEKGVVTRMVDGPVGGIALWLRGQDGVSYYFAHLQGFAPGIEVGRAVQIGTVLGYVGNTGNADGGAHHLHLEIHNPGPIRPKPIVDAWLDDAVANAPGWVDAVMGDVLITRRLLRSEQALAGVLSADRSPPAATPEYSMLLTLIDPVGGSAGLAANAQIVVPEGSEAPGRFSQITRLRVDGDIIASLRAAG